MDIKTTMTIKPGSYGNITLSGGETLTFAGPGIYVFKSIKNSGSKIVNGPKEAQIAVVLNGVVKDGKPTAMVAWSKQLSDVDIAAVITYTRNNWSNKTGDMVTPAEIKAARK